MILIALINAQCYATPRVFMGGGVICVSVHLCVQRPEVGVAVTVTGPLTEPGVWPASSGIACFCLWSSGITGGLTAYWALHEF